MRQLPLSAAIVAVVLFAAAVAGFGAALDGYSQAIHPVGLLGARGMPPALAFNVLGLVLPGVLAALVDWRLRARQSDGAGKRVSVPVDLGGGRIFKQKHK